jgi:hypothetical protein
MAIRTKTLTGLVPAGQRGNFLSDQILRPHRPIAVLLWTDTHEIGSTYTVFLTRSDTPVPAPQPGDPIAFEIVNMQTPGANPITIPVTSTETFEPPLRLALSFFNNAASSANVMAIYFYEE